MTYSIVLSFYGLQCIGKAHSQVVSYRGRKLKGCTWWRAES